MSELSRKEFETKIVNLASTNAAMREKLLDDPKGIIESMFTIELPEEMNIVFHEEDANTLHFVLPASGDELNAAELASVSGGMCWEHSNYPPV